MATIKELASINFTDAQLKGLAIANALANQERVSNDREPLSDVEYLTNRIHDVVGNYESQHVEDAELRVIVEKLKSGDADTRKTAREAAAQAVGADIAVEVPDVVKTADLVEVKP